GVALLATPIDTDIRFNPGDAFGSKIVGPIVKPFPVTVRVASCVGRLGEKTPTNKLLSPRRTVTGTLTTTLREGSGVGVRRRVIRKKGVPLATAKSTVVAPPAATVAGVFGVGRKSVSAEAKLEAMSMPRIK